MKLRSRRTRTWFSIAGAFIATLFLGSSDYEVAVQIGAWLFLLIFVAILYALYLGYRIGRVEADQASLLVPQESDLEPWWKLLEWKFLAVTLLFAWAVAALLSYSTLMVYIAAIIVLVVLFPMAVTAKASRRLRIQRWTRFSIYSIAVFVGGFLDRQAADADQLNFDSLIAATEQYKAANEHYPASLEQLVPTYLPAVPDARYGNKYMYYLESADSNNAYLIRRLVGFYRESYSFKSKLRRTSD